MPLTNSNSGQQKSVSRINEEAISQLNHNILLQAHDFAGNFLSGNFHSLYRIEKSYEFAEPEVYQPEHNPDQILWSKTDLTWLTRLPMAIANEELLIARYQQYTEYDFIIIADVSQSMASDWWPTYGAKISSKSIHLPRSKNLFGDQTKLFYLKLLLVSFLNAAFKNGFDSSVYLFGDNSVREISSSQQTNFAESSLLEVDEHFFNAAKSNKSEKSQLLKALEQVLLNHHQNSIILLLSDFRDTLQHINEEVPQEDSSDLYSLLGELNEKHNLITVQINDLEELSPQKEGALLDTRLSPILNTEKYVKSSGNFVKKRKRLDYLSYVDHWMEMQRNLVFDLGIPYQHIVAGQNDHEAVRNLQQLSQ